MATQKVIIAMADFAPLVSISVSNVLSFGPEGLSLVLEPLNVLVGPNGSGKSNFLELFRVFQSAPTDLSRPFFRGGGPEHWRYKGIVKSQNDTQEALYSDVSILTRPNKSFFFESDENSLVEQRFILYFDSNRFFVTNENISLFNASYDEPSNSKAISKYERKEIYQYAIGTGAIIAHTALENGDDEVTPYRVTQRHIDTVLLEHDQSILSQRNDPEAYPALYQLSNLYKGIHLFTENVFGRTSPARLPQDAALDSTFYFPTQATLRSS